MTLNDQIEALVLKNKVIKPVNMTAFKNPFLLLSTTRALNELVSNTAPSDRARQQGIEDDKAYLKTPTGARSDRKAPKTGKDAPKQDKQPKPATSSVKTPTTAKRGRGRPKDTPEKKEAKAATKDIIKEGAKNVVKVAKAAKAKAEKAAAAKAKADAKEKAEVDSEAKKQAANKAEVKRLKQVKADADAERKALEGRREGQSIPLGNTKIRGGNSSDRRLGTKTQKKKK